MMNVTSHARRTVFGTALAALTLLVACDGGETTAPMDPALRGAFRISTLELDVDLEIEEGTPMFTAGARYLRIEDDDTFSVLTEHGVHAIRSRRDGVAWASERQLSLDGLFFNYTIEGDVLTLSRPDAQIVLERDGEAPEADTWVVPVSVLAGPITLPEIDDATDLAWDGSGFWLGNGETDTIRKIAPDTGMVIATAPTSRSVNGIGWDGTNLWLSNNGHDTIARVDMSGSVLSTSPDMGAWIYGIAWDGELVWAYSGNEDSLYAFAPGADTLTTTIDLEDAPISQAGLEYVDGALYIASGGTILKCATSPFAVEVTYGFDDFYVTGIGHDGTDFYVVGYGSDYETIELARVALP